MNQYVMFSAAGEEYAVTILKVTEIIECPALTKVPGTPPWIRGVLNLRGAVVPVADLAVKFGLAPTPITRRTCVVMLELEHEGERAIAGVMADAVHQVIELAAEELPLVTLLDVERVLSPDARSRAAALRDLGKLSKSREIGDLAVSR